MAYDNIQISSAPRNPDLDIRLVIEGVSYTNFENMVISRSLNSLANSFKFDISQSWPDGKIRNLDIFLGASAIVVVNGESIINGYIDDIPIDYDSTGFKITYSGRDATADLADCSVDIDENTNQYLEQTAKSILDKLCAPFNILVAFDDTDAEIDMNDLSKPIAKFTIGVGDTVLTSIKSICQRYGVIAYSKGDGKLTITRSGSTTATDSLISGANILGASLKQSNRKRFSHYYVKAPFSQETITSEPKELKALVRDELITRNRPLVIVDSDLKTIEDCESKAAWMAAGAAGQSRMPIVKVQGWTQSNKAIWPVNSLVHYNDDKLGFNETMLIAAVEHFLDPTGGSTSTLSLVFPGTFERQKRTPVTKIKTAFDGKRSVANVGDPLPADWKKSAKSIGSFPSG